jgi:vacuolar-type H+-ATPase subunit I/STV1
MNLIPNFKNNLGNFLKNVGDEIYIICNNYIDHGINVYLNKLKIKIQKRKDEKLNKINLKNRKIDLKNIKKLNNEEEKKYYDKLIKDDYNILDEYLKEKKNLINSPEQIKNDDERIYELNDFFENKYVKYKNVKFTNERIKEKIFNFYIKNLY